MFTNYETCKGCVFEFDIDNEEFDTDYGICDED